MSSKVFTSIISEDLFVWLDKFSKRIKKSKRSIIEESLKKMRDEIKKQEMERAFTDVSSTQEMFELAEMGLEDSIEQIKKHETKRDPSS